MFIFTCEFACEAWHTKMSKQQKKKFNCFRANFYLPSLLTNVYHLLGLRTKPVQLAYSYIFAREIFNKK